MSIIEKVVDKLGKETSGEEKPAAKDRTPAIEKAIADDTGPKIQGQAVPSSTNEHQSRDLPPVQKPKKRRRSRKVTIDLQKLNKAGFLTPGTLKIVLAEQYRRIKRTILINAFDDKAAELKNRNVVLVTSAMPGEGKSFSSMNLALSIAQEINRTVLFIDADVAKRANTRFLGLDGTTGLTDFLMDKNQDLSDFMLSTNIPNLAILPAGTYYDSTHELWATARMSDFLDELSGRYEDRVIIIDAAPVLQDSSTHILTRLVGQVIFVIEAEKTPQNLVMDALENISDSQYIGLVLNKSNRRLVSEYGYYAHVNTRLPDVKQRSEGSG